MKQYLNKSILRFSTAGSIDDGKSTLIGRLLYDSKSLLKDQYEQIENASKKKGFDEVDLSLITDGLKDEREQGITIDVAYRYFSTDKRSFIIADTPGHIEYTRNMITGASTSNLSLILIDVTKGVLEQTLRHVFISSILGIKHIIFCINKMDLVNYSEKEYIKVKKQIYNHLSKLDIKDVNFVPISALKGDNIVKKSRSMDWYMGLTLLYLLENTYINSDYNLIDARFPIQYIINTKSKNSENHRLYAGKVSSGIFRPGDEIKILPSGFTSKIKSINTFNGDLNEVFAPMSVSFILEDKLNINRGNMIVKINNLPTISQDIEILIFWMSENKLDKNKKYIIKHTTNEVKCIIKTIHYKIDINTYSRINNDLNIGLNDIAKLTLRLANPIFFDNYLINRVTGSIIIIDEITNETVGAGVIKN